MNITSTQMRRMPGASKPLPKSEAPNGESTFGAKDVLADVAAFSIGAVQGVVPGYGAYANFESFVVRGMYQPDNIQSKIAGAGVFLNLAGAVSLGVGLIGGNNTAAMAGGALLLASGVTNGQAYL